MLCITYVYIQCTLYIYSVCVYNLDLLLMFPAPKSDGICAQLTLFLVACTEICFGTWWILMYTFHHLTMSFGLENLSKIQHQAWGLSDFTASQALKRLSKTELSVDFVEYRFLTAQKSAWTVILGQLPRHSSSILWHLTRCILLRQWQYYQYPYFVSPISSSFWVGMSRQTQGHLEQWKCCLDLLYGQSQAAWYKFQSCTVMVQCGKNHQFDTAFCLKMALLWHLAIRIAICIPVKRSRIQKARTPGLSGCAATKNFAGKVRQVRPSAINSRFQSR